MKQIKVEDGQVFDVAVCVCYVIALGMSVALRSYGTLAVGHRHFASLTALQLQHGFRLHCISRDMSSSKHDSCLLS